VLSSASARQRAWHEAAQGMQRVGMQGGSHLVQQYAMTTPHTTSNTPKSCPTVPFGMGQQQGLQEQPGLVARARRTSL